MHPYSSIDTTAAWKKLRFILSVRSDVHMIDSLSIAVHVFVSRVKYNTSLNNSRAWDINGATNEKIHVIFIKYFKWHMSKFEPSWIISLQITVIWVKLLLQVFKTMEKSNFRVLIKLCFLMGKNPVQAKQWLDKCYSDSAPPETTVKR